MRLISLTCDQPTFRALRFNNAGLTIIIGDSAKENKEGSSNGVGKTLALGLVHHCLGAKADNLLAAAVPNWLFSLLVNIKNREYRIDRTGDGKKIFVNGELTSLAKFRSWLDESGAFRLEADVPLISFRSLFKRFARYAREDCLDPLRTNRENDFDARLRTLYLAGLDCSLVVSKMQYKHDLDQIAQALKNWRQDDILKDVFRAGAQPKVRAEWLEREIPRLREDLEKFQVAEDYRSIEMEAGDLTKKIRTKEKELAVIDFQLESIDKSLAQHPDISRQDLLDLYQGLQEIFKPEVLAHFEAVEKFHNSLSISRRKRLENDRLKLLSKHHSIDTERKLLVELRDKKLQSLQGKRALDEYASVANQFAALEEERNRLNQFLNFSTNLQQRAQNIREQRVEEDRRASEYISSNPLALIDNKFAELAEVMYPRVPAGVVLEVNTGDNQLRYEISVQIEGDDSDGINAARIMCFDWCILMYGANHAMDLLWHDNRLFADIDPGARAAWFSHVYKELHASGKQYIVSINTENYKSMKQYFSPELATEIEKTIVITLRGDIPENKLLGIQFGKTSN
jgi:uncharacterized protein YydD (DUF2326 family)